MRPNGNSLSERVYQTIRAVEQKKAAERIWPDHALLTGDLSRMLGLPPATLYWACAELYRQQRITGGNTVNDKYFKTL